MDKLFKRGANEGMSFSLDHREKGRFLFLDVQNYFGERQKVYQWNYSKVRKTPCGDWNRKL